MCVYHLLSGGKNVVGGGKLLSRLVPPGTCNIREVTATTTGSCEYRQVVHLPMYVGGGCVGCRIVVDGGFKKCYFFFSEDDE